MTSDVNPTHSTQIERKGGEEGDDGLNTRIMNNIMEEEEESPNLVLLFFRVQYAKQRYAMM